MYLYSKIVCETTTVDSQTNKLSLINCIEQINTAIIPNVYPIVSIVTQWFNDNKEDIAAHFTFRIVIEQPDGNKEEKTFEHTIEKVKDNDRHRVIINLQGLPLKQTGIMKLHLEEKENEDWKSLGYIPITITRVEKI